MLSIDKNLLIFFLTLKEMSWVLISLQRFLSKAMKILEKTCVIDCLDIVKYFKDAYHTIVVFNIVKRYIVPSDLYIFSYDWL